MEHETPPPPRVGRAWWGVAVLLLLYVLSFVDRQVINLMVDPIKRDLGIGEFEASLLMGFGFAVFYALFGIPIARLSDSRSRRGIIAIGLVVWSAMTAFCGIARGYAQLLLARMSVGVGEASLSPAAYSLIADSFPPRRLGTALGVYSIATYLGPGLASVLGGVVIGIVGDAPTRTIPIVGVVHSWQVVFLVVGLPGLLLVPLLWTVTEPARRARETIPFAATLRHLWTHRAAYVTHNVGFALLSLSGYASGFWAPAFLQRNHGMTKADSGIALGWILIVAGTAGVVCGGWLTDVLAARGRRDAPIRSGWIASIVWVPAGILYPLVHDRTLALALMSAAIFAAAMPWGAAAAAIQEMTPAPMRAQASAIYLFTISLIGLGLGPSAVAFLTQYVYGTDLAVRYSLMWVTLAAHLLAAAALALGMPAYVRTLNASPGRSAPSS